ncbi:MAG TPA: hypothetical protein VFX03_03080, partial [Thermomicrobiales bacterium]|nr:hypothetical protein [Thermomicrobiales bacterium]
TRKEATMQGVVTGYVGNWLKDELLKPATAPLPPPEGAPPPPDRQELQNEDGETIGVACLAAGVSVYVVSDGYGTPQTELARCISDPNSTLMVQTEGGRITALIYVPDPDLPSRKTLGLRAEDV